MEEVDIGTGNDVSEERRALADAVNELCRLLGPQEGRALTGKGIISRLDRVRHTGTIPSSLSRYRSGKTVPPEHFLRVLHRAACEDAGSDAACISVDDLLRMRAAIKDVRAEARDLRMVVRQLHIELENLRMKDGATAGETAKMQSPLPVPAGEGDRQRSNYGDAVERFVSQVGQLYCEGAHEEVLGVLRETSQLLGPGQLAACIALFRERALDVLADTLVHGFGRDHPDRAVMLLASRLLEMGMPKDASALLRLAIE